MMAFTNMGFLERGRGGSRTSVWLKAANNFGIGEFADIKLHSGLGSPNRFKT